MAMAPRKMSFLVTVALLVTVPAAVLGLATGGQQAQPPVVGVSEQPQAAAAVPGLATGRQQPQAAGLEEATDGQQPGQAPAAPRVMVGDEYIGCLEMHFARCYASPTLVCLEDAMVECSSLQQAAAAPGAPPAPTGPEATELLLGAIGGAIGRGVTSVASSYIDCLELDLPKCMMDPSLDCVENAMADC